MRNLLCILREKRKNKKIEDSRELLKNSLVLLVSVYGVRKDNMTETEKGFVHRAMDNIALAIGKLEDAKEIPS